MNRLSVCLIFYNEAKNLPNWLKSISLIADEIIAIDSGSTDESINILLQAGARVEYRDWTGYADQRNFAASLATGNWLLFLDADERPDKKLCQAIIKLKRETNSNLISFELSFKNFFLGRYLSHGRFKNERHLRLYKPLTGYWKQREVHEKLKNSGLIKHLPGFIEHYSYLTIHEYIERMNRYSVEAAKQMYLINKKVNYFSAIYHSSWTFLNYYLLQLGFLDGFAGYLFASLNSIYTFIKYIKLLELKYRK